MSGYTKLFSSIVHSTIWREADHVRLVWITMLALSDSEGVVEASIPGLADAARVTLEHCEDALRLLSEPDPYSRNPEHEGRRVVAVEGGWLILNRVTYRERESREERRERARERKRKQREREAQAQEKAQMSRGKRDVTRDSVTERDRHAMSPMSRQEEEEEEEEIDHLGGEIPRLPGGWARDRPDEPPTPSPKRDWTPSEPSTAERLAEGFDRRMLEQHGERTRHAEGSSCASSIARVARWLDDNGHDPDDWLDRVFSTRPRKRLRWHWLEEDPGAAFVATKPESALLEAELELAREAFEDASRRLGRDHPTTAKASQRWRELSDQVRGRGAA